MGILKLKEDFIGNYIREANVDKAFFDYNRRAVNGLRDDDPLTDYIEDFDNFTKEINPAKFYTIWDLISSLNPKKMFYCNNKFIKGSKEITLPSPVFYNLYSKKWVVQTKNAETVFVRPIDADEKLMPEIVKRNFENNEDLRFIWELLHFNLDDPIVFNSLLRFSCFHGNRNNDVYEKLKKYGL